MTTIECTNPNCTSPTRPPTFEWDEKPYLLTGGRVVAAGTPKSVRMNVVCTYCGTVGTVGIIGLKHRLGDEIVRVR